MPPLVYDLFILAMALVFGGLGGYLVAYWKATRLQTSASVPQDIPGNPPVGDEAREFLRTLHQLTQRIGNEIGDHSKLVQRLNTELLQDECNVASVLARLIQENERMTEQLNDAESRLNSQAMMIELHINEARSDPLTTLANRRAFDDEMRNQIQQFEQHATPASVLLLDIDHFKMLNDAHGHIVGDDVLIAVSQAIKQHIRTEDFAARYGGEEFAIIFPRTRVEQAISIAERVRASVSRAVCQITDQPIRITASGGLSLLMPMDTQKSWLDRADKALYYSKDSGRDCGHFSDGEAFKPFVERARPLPSASKSTNIKSSDVLQDSPLEADDAQELLDPVTQLLSAETFKKYFARTLAERRRTGTALSLIMIRIDRFQDYPQRYGITTDSLILRIIGRLLHSSVRSSDHVARYANDSLIILLPKANLINAVRVAKRLGAAIEKLNLRLADQRIDLTVSMGVGEERGSDGSALLIDRVTRAVAIASRSGGNQLVVSDGEMFDRETFATHCEKSAPADSPLSTATPRIPPISPIFPNPGFDPAVPSHWSSS